MNDTTTWPDLAEQLAEAERQRDQALATVKRIETALWGTVRTDGHLRTCFAGQKSKACTAACIDVREALREALAI